MTPSDVDRLFPADLYPALNADMRANPDFLNSACSNCGRLLQPGQVESCSPHCANESWERDNAALQASYAAKKAALAAALKES